MYNVGTAGVAEKECCSHFDMNREYLTFLRELPKSFSEIGAMLPSSPALGRALVKPIRDAHRPLNILEVGPGTGPVTRQILRLLRSEDRFTICEINRRFLELLKTNLESNRSYRRHRERITFFEGAIQDLPRSDVFQAKYDIIVSSLPFSNFTPEAVSEILSVFDNIISEDGSVSFMEYVAVRKVTSLFASRESRARLDGVERVVQNWMDRIEQDGKVRKRVSLMNLPPAMAIHLDYHSKSAA